MNSCHMCVCVRGAASSASKICCHFSAFPFASNSPFHKSVFAPLHKGNCCCLSYFLKTEMNSRPFKLFSCRFVSHFGSTLQNIRSSTYSSTYLLLPIFHIVRGIQKTHSTSVKFGTKYMLKIKCVLKRKHLPKLIWCLREIGIYTIHEIPVSCFMTNPVELPFYITFSRKET